MLTVMTAGDPNTDVALTIYDSTGTNALTQAETGGLVTAQAKAAASTTYYVVFAAGQLFSATDGTYQALIRLQ